MRSKTTCEWSLKRDFTTAVAALIQGETLLLRGCVGLFFQLTLLIAEHGGGKLPSGRRRVPPRGRNGDQAVGTVIWIDMEEAGMAANQTPGVIRGRSPHLDEAAVGGNFIKRQHSCGSDKENSLEKRMPMRRLSGLLNSHRKSARETFNS